MKRKIFTSIMIVAVLVTSFSNVSLAKSQQEYTIKKGDTLWSISKYFLRDGSRFNEIFEKNRNVVEVPELIYPGKTIIIDCSEADTTLSQGTFRVTADEYQCSQIYLDSEYTIEKSLKFDKNFKIVFAPEVAEVKNGKIVPKSIGAGFLFLLDNKGEVYNNSSIAVVEPEAIGVWTNDDQWVYESNSKNIKSVKSSDESVAKAYFEGRKVYAKGVAVGSCQFTITYEDGSKEIKIINDIGEWSEQYECCFALVNE